MEEYVATVTYLLAAGTVLLGLLILVTLITRLATGAWFPPSMENVIRTYALHGVAASSLGASLLAFWYSEVVGFAPCPLCWLARTMLFPVAVISVVAAWRRDAQIWPYLLSLSIIGMCITGYHHLYQMNFVSGALCNALEGGGDCAKRLVFEFGFVTMPLMGFVLFALTALLAWIYRIK